MSKNTEGLLWELAIYDLLFSPSLPFYSPKISYIFLQSPKSWESKKMTANLLEGMKMALDFLLGLYPFLFVVVATLKIIKKYQVKKQLILT